jgi:hypothetical protein
MYEAKIALIIVSYLELTLLYIRTGLSSVCCGNMKNRLHNNITIFCVVTLCNLIDRYLFLMFPSSGWEQDTLY